MPLLAPTKPKKNMLPPFTSGQWTLHENTRMKQANFIGKVSGSTVENPHTVYPSSGGPALSPPLTLQSVNSEFSSSGYSQLMSLEGITQELTAPLTTGSTAKHLLSFNLIEHALRNYGASVFGSAVSVADRVAWLKENIAKYVVNWYGWGSGPAGNKAYVAKWDNIGLTWANSVVSHTQGTVTRAPANPSSVTTNFIDTSGFVHYLAYADASDGVTTSAIRTDFIELEVVMKEGSIPQPDYELTLNATAIGQASEVYVPCVPGDTYTISGILTGDSNIRFRVRALTPNGTIIQTTSSTGSASFVVPSDVSILHVAMLNNSATGGLYIFTNPQLERGSVATAFEPYALIPDNKPVRQGLRFNGLTDYVDIPHPVGMSAGDFAIEVGITMLLADNKEPNVFYPIVIKENNVFLELSGTPALAGKLHARIDTTTAANQTIQSNASIVDSYKFIRYEVQGGVLKTYVDGVFQSSKNITGTLLFNANLWRVATNTNRVRSTKLQVHFLRMFSQGNVIGEWRFDEGQGTTAYDKSGNGNHGAITGATWNIKQAVKIPEKNVLPLFNDPSYVYINSPVVSSDGRSLRSNASSASQMTFVSNDNIPVEPGVQYRLSAILPQAMGRVRLGRIDNTFLADITPNKTSQTFPTTERLIRLSVDNHNGSVYVPGMFTVADIMICKASEDQTYEPYTLVNTPSSRIVGSKADNFNRPDSATSIGGNIWTVAQGTWGIQNNQAYSVTASTFDIVWTDIGSTRFTASVDAAGQYNTSFHYPSLIVHYVNAANYIWTRLDSNSVALLKREADTNTVLINLPMTVTNGQRYNHKIVANDGTLQFYLDNVLIGPAYTMTAAERNIFLPSEKVGFRVTKSGTPLFPCYFDNFRYDLL